MEKTEKNIKIRKAP